MGKIHAAFLDHRAILQDPATTAAALFPVPGILAEGGAAIFGGQFVTDAILQVQQIVLDRLQ